MSVIIFNYHIMFVEALWHSESGCPTLSLFSLTIMTIEA